MRRVVMFMLRRVRVRPFDLNEALRANRLIAASSLVEVWWIVQEANRAICRVLVKKHLYRLSIYKRVIRKLYLPWDHF